jgi:hypothetical protein
MSFTLPVPLMVVPVRPRYLQTVTLYPAKNIPVIAEPAEKQAYSDKICYFQTVLARHSAVTAGHPQER